jgi:antitoxin (DNA-binding transcriptional repressor) of toxin-antitoxin stability system
LAVFASATPCGSLTEQDQEVSVIVNSITQAKAQLSALVERVRKGEDVVIAKAGKPVAVLRAYGGPPRQRIPGALRGRIHIAKNFDELPADIAEAFGAR